MNDHPAAYQRACVQPEVKAVNSETKEVVHLISNARTDRAGDVVEPGGVQLDNYMRNPIVMIDHDYSVTNIIGRAESIEIGEGGVYARTKFQTDTQLGRDAWALVKGGFARSWSIGFKPLEHEAIKDGKQIKGFHFKTWELLEYSLVAIPMNPDAVMGLAAKGVIDKASIPHLIHLNAEAKPQEARSAANVEPPQKQHYLDAVMSALQTARTATRGAQVSRLMTERRPPNGDNT